ncbi:MAG: hypothetical protein HQL40_04190 [Alphaproteobacteria bacterium]|nr:hypothetical protein [Alphaproteobacteria bacterium]
MTPPTHHVFDRMILLADRMNGRVASAGDDAALREFAALAPRCDEPMAMWRLALATAQAVLRNGDAALARRTIEVVRAVTPDCEINLESRICDIAESVFMFGDAGMAADFGDLLTLADPHAPRAAELHLMAGRPGRCLAVLDGAADGPTVTVLKGWALFALGETRAAAEWLERRHAVEGPTCEGVAVQTLLDLAAGRVEMAGERLLSSLRADFPSILGLTMAWEGHVFPVACRRYCERAFGDPFGPDAARLYRAILDERPEYPPSTHVWTLHARCLGPPAPPGRLPDILLNNRGAKGGSAVQPILFDALAPLGYSFAPMSDKPIDPPRFLGTEGPIAQWAHMQPASVEEQRAFRPDRRLIVVQVLRDPRDTLMSAWGRHHLDGLEHAPPPDAATMAALELGSDLWAWSRPDILSVKVEDVRRDPQGQLRRILAAADIQLGDDDIRRAAAGKSMADYMARRRARLGRNLPDEALGHGVWRKGVTGEWRAAPPAVKRMMFELLGGAIKELDYETGDGWIDGET